MEVQDSNLVEIYYYLNAFKKNSKVTYVEVLRQMGAVFIEVPYSYESFMRFGKRQQIAICQAELLKLNLSPEIISIHPDAFYLTKNESDVALFQILMNQMKTKFKDKDFYYMKTDEWLNIWKEMISIMDNRTKPYLGLLSLLVKDLHAMEDRVEDRVKYILRYDVYSMIKEALTAILDNGEADENVKEEIRQLIGEIKNYQFPIDECQ